MTTQQQPQRGRSAEEIALARRFLRSATRRACRCTRALPRAPRGQIRLNHDALPRVVRNASHGGVDYAEPCRRHGPEAVRVCHIRPTGTPSHAPGKAEHDDKWWFGFRTSHPGDLVPTGIKPDRYREEGETYRDMHYVFAEVLNLARALKAFTDRPVEGRSEPLQLGSRPIDEDQA